MADQNYGNHRKFFPLFHFVVAPLLLLNFLYMARHAWQNPVFSQIEGAVLAFTLVLLGLASRLMALKVQDRVIRLEERLRLRELATGELKNRIGELSAQQLVGLRFASDAEVCDLASAALRDNVQKADAIKKQVKSWRADHHRA
jgi:hypothetical protein